MKTTPSRLQASAVVRIFRLFLSRAFCIYWHARHPQKKKNAKTIKAVIYIEREGDKEKKPDTPTNSSLETFLL